ncbi:MAG: GNAT family N-acetyltransferase [Phycisphaerales bacterium]|nr:GNAT family N-acetyltransferase [Phycisphaerales bacterium]
MLDRVPHVLAGRHVRVERLDEGHADGLLAIGADAEIWRHLSRPPIRTRDDALAYIVSAQAPLYGEGPQQAFAVIDLASGDVAGTTRYLDMRSDHRGLEIGWTWYGLRFQRTAVNTECKHLLLTHAFEVMRCIRVYFKTDHLNERSQRAIERLGAHRDGVLRNHRIRRDGTYRHSVYYTILEDEWPEVRQRLQARLDGAD